MKELKNKIIVVTGGTGFLGKYIVRELLKHEPKSIRVFSRDEVKHYKMQQEFKSDKLRYLIGDVRDYDRINQAFKGADIVIHAAAIKRIDLIEYNVEESVKTNVLGTMNVVRASFANNLEKAIFISSDKACSPLNTYGASKMIGERIFIESNYNKGDSKTVLACVRYGNVLGSTGSVIPFFKKKIEAGDVLPITDMNMTRFIITPERAVEIIMLAIEHAEGGELFVPKLPSFHIMDLVKILQGKKDIETKEVGIRPGEKIHEELINDDEVKRCYDLGNYFVVLSQIDLYRKNKLPYKYILDRKLVDVKYIRSPDFLIERIELNKILFKDRFMFNSTNNYGVLV